MKQFFVFSIIGLGILFNCMQGEEVKNARSFVCSVKDSFLEQEKSNQQKISAIQVFGQRCSGTNYLQTLLTRNVQRISLDYRYGWKHYPCWHDTSWKEAYKMHFNPYYLDLADSENYLFIFIVRNPYEWAYSFYKHPHNVSYRVDRSSFSSFLSSTWYTEHEHKMQEILENNRVGPEGVQFRNDWISVYFSKPEAHQGLSTGFWDLEPTGLSYFKNVLALRTARLENFLKIAEKVGNVCIIKYETLRDHPQIVLQEIAKKFGLSLKEKFVPVLEYKGHGGRFVPKKYLLSETEKAYIKQNLDLRVERVFGYDL